jgi:DNA transformation protein and related proteins
VREPDKLSAYLLELLTPLGPAAARRMFGGVGLFMNGTMFALIVREEVFFKVGDSNRPAFEAAGEGPFTYETKNGTHTLGSYWRCPPDLLDDGEIFRDWARGAIEASMAAIRDKAKPGRGPKRGRGKTP